MNQPTLFDTNQELFRSAFQQAQDFSSFVHTGQPQHKERWENYLRAITPTAQQQELFSAFRREMNILVLAGMWCGDCARQCPMIESLGGLSPLLSVRYIDNQENVRLRDVLRIHGASRVPVVVTLSEDYFEIGRFGDRTLSSYRRKAARELGAACDSGIGLPPADELAEELAEWAEHFERQQLLLRVSPMLRKRHND